MTVQAPRCQSDSFTIFEKNAIKEEISKGAMQVILNAVGVEKQVPVQFDPLWDELRRVKAVAGDDDEDAEDDDDEDDEDDDLDDLDDEDVDAELGEDDDEAELDDEEVVEDEEE